MSGNRSAQRTVAAIAGEIMRVLIGIAAFAATVLTVLVSRHSRSRPHCAAAPTLSEREEAERELLSWEP